MDLLELQVLREHLSVDAEEVLRATLDLDLQSFVAQLLRELRTGLADVAIAVLGALVELPRELRVDVIVEVLKAEVFELLLDLREPQAVGDWRKDVQRLLADGLLTIGAHVLHRPHVVESVGELDQDDADVLGHREDHLSACSACASSLERIQLSDLGDAVDHLGDLIAEEVEQVALGDQAVFHGVVQQTGRDGVDVHLPVGQDAGHGERMSEVGLSLLFRTCPAWAFALKT